MYIKRELIEISENKNTGFKHVSGKTGENIIEEAEQSLFAS